MEGLTSFPDTNKGFTSNAQKGAFKGVNDLGKLPAGGGTFKGVGSTERKAEEFITKHSTKGLRGPRPFQTKVRPLTNFSKSIGRKRGY